MYAVIRTDSDGKISVLRTCYSREAAIIACQLEKETVSYQDRSRIAAVLMDDGRYSEIRV